MKTRISYKLIGAVGGVTITIIAVFSYFMIRAQQSALIHKVEDTANQISETIKSGTKYDMLLNQPERIHRIVDAIGEQNGIEKIRVFNKQGAIIYSTDRSEVGEFLDKQAESCYACHAVDQPLEKLPIPERTRTFFDKQDTRLLGVINPIYNEPGCWQASCHAHDEDQTVLGVLDVTLSLEDVDNQISASRSRMVLFAISAIAVISFLLWFLVQRLIGKPVAELVRATEEVSSGNIEYKISELHNDELGILGKSFNEMTGKLISTQRQLYQSDKLASLGRLAAGLAHEINNPLTAVLTNSSILLNRNDLVSEVKEDLEVILNESKRCREIVKRLLDFARPVPSEKVKLEANDVIIRTLRLLDNQFKKKHILVTTKCSKDVQEIFADPNQLQQVLVNLLVNAADAIGTGGGTITLSTHPKQVDGEAFVVIEVTDSGAGMSEEVAAKIFEPFFTTKAHKGTGLGLSVVWGIMEEHGGRVAVKSEPGKGSIFNLFFPVAESKIADTVVR